jgi:hypothetical protein
MGGVAACRLDENSDAEQEDYEEKLKELEDVANPVVSKVGTVADCGERCCLQILPLVMT